MSGLDWHARQAFVARELLRTSAWKASSQGLARWCVALFGCSDASVPNVKQICHRENSDGIDIVNSQDVLVDGCFLRNNDDEVCVKTAGAAAGARKRRTSRPQLGDLERPRLRPGVTCETRGERQPRAVHRLRRDPRPGHRVAGRPCVGYRHGKRPAVRERLPGGREAPGDPPVDRQRRVGARSGAGPRPRRTFKDIRVIDSPRPSSN